MATEKYAFKESKGSAWNGTYLSGKLTPDVTRSPEEAQRILGWLSPFAPISRNPLRFFRPTVALSKCHSGQRELFLKQIMRTLLIFIVLFPSMLYFFF